MQLPLQITFRHMAPSPAIEADVAERAAKLERLCDRIIGCRVMIEAPHHHHRQGGLYHVRIEVTVPGKDLVVNREPHANHAHEDVYVTLRDAFQAATRQLEDWVREHRGDVKAHSAS